MRKKLGMILVTLGVGLAAQTFAQDGPFVPESVTWEERLYNPNPMADDLVLPLPCGGAMVFRKVTTPNTDGVVGDVPVILGQQGSEQPFLDGLRKSFVSGAFPDGEGTTRGYFLIAKYELTEAQHQVSQVASAEDCPNRIGRRQAIPVTGLSKAEIERFAERYTVWLMNNAQDLLPAVGSTIGYVRLPTEEEWEFAARGGLNVAPSEFRATRPPIPDGESINEYIAHNGSDSAGGDLQIIGTLKPNPLGLHDMLGNAWEMVGTPFALVRHGRLHGQAGGIVRRGGGVDWPVAEITSAQRFEMAPYSVRRLDVQTNRFTGARFVLSAISITSDDQNSALIAELDRMAQPDPGLVTARSEEEVRSLLDQMQSSAVTPREKTQIQIIQETLAAATAERNSQRDQSLRMISNSSVLLCNQAVQRYLTARLASDTALRELDELEEIARSEGDDAFLADVLDAQRVAQERLASLNEKLREDVIEYANLIEGLAVHYDADVVMKQVDFVREDHMTRGDTSRRAECYKALRRHLQVRFTAGLTDFPIIQEDFQSIAIAVLDGALQ